MSNSPTVPPAAPQPIVAPHPLMRFTLKMSDAGRAMHLLAKAANLEPRLLDIPQLPEVILEDEVRFDRWMEATADYFGIESEAVETSFAGLPELVSGLGPGLLRVIIDEKPRLLPVLRGGRDDVIVVNPGGRPEKVPAATVIDAIFGPALTVTMPIIDGWLDRAGVPKRKRPKVRKALLLARFGGMPCCRAWILRLSPAAPTWMQFHATGVTRRLGMFLVLTGIHLSIGLLEWFILGHGATNGTLPQSSAIGWVLLSLTTIPIQVTSNWLVARIGVDVAAIVKRRLLVGALSLEPNDIRERGSGQLLAMVGESQTLEAAGLGSVLSVVSALVSLFTAGAILSIGIGGALHVMLMIAWAAMMTVGTLIAGKRNAKWTETRLSMTNRLVERMLGHRTRAVQESPRSRHAAEDDELENYVAASQGLDRIQALLAGLPSRGWLAIGFISMIPALLQSRADASSILITVGGLMSAQGAFAGLSDTVQGLLSFGVAWKSVGPLFAAARLPKGGLPVTVSPSDNANADAEGQGEILLDAKNMSFRYRAGGDPVLHHASVTIRARDRILLEGKSGGGKSTFVGLLAGMRAPEAGLLLFRGLDRVTLGEGEWRRRIASVPQFHENHILTGTMAFNVLLGRNWPPNETDLQIAREVLEALGLGPLLERMPSGLDQQLGETGWQLSHGEKSRVFLARALIQDSDIVLLDETFGALDPVTMKVCVDAATERANALLVIAHP